MRISYWSSDVCSSDLRPPCGKLLWGADYRSLRGTLMSEDMGAAGASALVTGRMSNRMNSQISVVGGRRRWSVDQELVILREAFGPDGSVSPTCQRHAVGSGMLYAHHQARRPWHNQLHLHL